MNKNEIIKLLCDRLAQLKSVEEIDYPRIEELATLILAILHKKDINN